MANILAQHILIYSHNMFITLRTCARGEVISRVVVVVVIIHKKITKF